MTYFTRLATYQTTSRRIGHTRELTAKLAGSRIVFAGGANAQMSIEADADIRLINAYWKLYCSSNNDGTTADPTPIDRADIDAARGK